MRCTGTGVARTDPTPPLTRLRLDGQRRADTKKEAEDGSRAQGVAGAARSPQGEDTGHPRRA